MMKRVKKLSLFCLVSIVCIGFTLGIHPQQACAKKIELSLANEAPPFFVYTIAHITVLLIALTAAKMGHTDKVRFVKKFLPNL